MEKGDISFQSTSFTSPRWTKKQTIFCFFAPSIHIAYRNGVEKIRKGQKHMDFTTARQCHYCNNYFIKSAEKIEKHLSCCAGKAGFTFSFGNGKIIEAFSLVSILTSRQLRGAWYFMTPKCLWLVIVW